MIREEYFRRLVDAAHILLFLAGVDGARLYWPWRMARTGGSLGESYRNACEVYWVDSAIQDGTYGNKDVLDDALEFDAEAALLADTMGDYGETVSALKEGLNLADDHPFDGNIVIPLQAPFDECYAEFAGESEYYAIGGLKDADTDAPRIEAAQTVRELAGTDVHLHGLGWGVRDELMNALHSNPQLLDSVDYSSPVQSNTHAVPGDERMTVTAAEAGAQLIRDLRRASPHVDFNPNPESLRASGQSGFEVYQD